MPRLALAWAALVAGLAVAFALLRSALPGTPLLLALALVWLAMGKTASLLVMPDADRRRLGWRRMLAYLIWPGMQPAQFLPERVPAASDIAPTPLGVLLNLMTGLLFLYAIPTLMPPQTPFFLRVWSGLIGAAFLLLIVRFGLAALLWRAMGFAVEKLWHCPIAAVSLGDFWGQRWNRVMSGLLREVVFLPLARRVWATAALLAVFLYSGVLHEFCSVPVDTGYGGPTLYFLIQGAGVWLEGRGGMRRAMRRWPWLGRAWTATVVLAPLPLVLHAAFVDGVLVPMLREMRVPGVADG